MLWRVRAIALALVVVLAAVTVGRAARSWPRDAHLGYAEGIWLGLAVDASNGVLYRPLDGPQGIGGSRYFPLFYLAIAAGLVVGLAPITAGYLVATASVALLLFAVFMFLRRLGVDAVLAIVAAGAALACQPVQMSVLATRGDGLAAALALLGLAFSLPGSRRWLAPVLFALAFATKPTSLYAPIAAVAALAFDGQAIESRRLALRTLAVIAGVLAVLMVASGGRMLPVLMASSSGGAGLGTALAAPLSAARILRRVPESAFFIQVAAAVLIGLRLTSNDLRGLSVERVAFICCAISTLAIYASPATIENHLIDLTVLAIVVLTAWAAKEERWSRMAMALLIVGGIAAGTSAVWRSRTEDLVDRRTDRSEVLAALSDVKTPILFDQPMLAVQRGEAPHVIDQYVHTIRISKDPAAIDSLVTDIEAGKFGAIVFDIDAIDLTIGEIYPGETGARFRSALDRSYRLDRQVAGKPIYRPR